MTATIDRAIKIATLAAEQAARVLAVDEQVELWPTLFAAEGQQFTADAAIATVLAPFVRANPTSPPEALYIQAHLRGVHRGARHGWKDLPYAVRAAYSTFAQTLTTLDSGLAEERARLQQHVGAPAKPRPPFHDSETIAEKVDGVTDRTGKAELGTPSKITRGARPAPAKSAEDDALDALKQAHLARLNTNLNAKSGLPTLAQRIAREGVAKQLGIAPKAKRKK